jgi:galactokinase
MFATHKGLSEQYEVSCKELDFLVAVASGMPDVIGARMMGGGFGGCTINIVKEDKMEEVIKYAGEKYRMKFQKELKSYIVQIEDGTAIIH